MALTDNLQGWWTLDETSGTRYDSTANNNDLSVIGSPTYRTGKKSNALDTPTTHGYVAIADASQTGLDITGDMGIGLWIYRDSYSAQWRGLVTKVPDATHTQYSFGIYNANDNGANKKYILYWSSDGTNLTYKYPVATIPIDTWVFVVFNYDASAGTLDIHHNGASTPTVTATALPTSIFNSNAPFAIGDSNGSNEGWDGGLDEVGIWDRLLTADEIATLYNSGNGVTYTDISATSITVTPTTLALTGAIVAPTISTTQNITVTPSELALTSATVAPAVVAEATVAPNVLALTSALLAPSVTAGGDVTISATVLALTSELVAPTISTESNITVAASVFELTGAIIAPTVSVVSSQTVTPSILSLTFGLIAPLIRADAWSRVARNSTGDWTRSGRNST